MKVLLIGDGRDVSGYPQIAVGLQEIYGHEVLVCWDSTVEDAVAAATNFCPDVAVYSLFFPGTWIELAKGLRAAGFRGVGVRWVWYRPEDLEQLADGIVAGMKIRHDHFRHFPVWGEKLTAKDEEVHIPLPRSDKRSAKRPVRNYYMAWSGF